MRRMATDDLPIRSWIWGIKISSGTRALGRKEVRSVGGAGGGGGSGDWGKGADNKRNW